MSTGVLVVLEVDPAYVDPRDAVINPVLYAGDVTVIRLNHGNRSGRVIGIIPGDVNLATAPIWFGSPQLPERLTESIIQSERERAEKAGVRAFPSARISAIERPVVAAKISRRCCARRALTWCLSSRRRRSRSRKFGDCPWPRHRPDVNQTKTLCMLIFQRARKTRHEHSPPHHWCQMRRSVLAVTASSGWPDH